MEYNGLLIMSGNTKICTIKNVLAALSNKKIKKYNIPTIRKILFLDLVDKNCNTKYESRITEYSNAVQEIFGDREHIEIRFKLIYECQEEVPQIITDAIKEVGKDNVILDLTNGLKILTGSLYTAASICELKNIYYVKVLKDNNGEFFVLTQDTEDINDKCEISQFAPMKEIVQLGNINKIEFVFYTKSIEELLGGMKNNLEIESIKNTYQKAINDYFLLPQNKENFISTIRSTGIIIEKLISKVERYFYYKLSEESIAKVKKNSTDFKESGKSPYSNLNIYFREYRKKFEKKNSDELLFEELCDLESLIALDYMFYTMKELRNAVSHPGKANISRNEAKIALDTTYHILKILKESSILVNILKEEKE